MPLAAVDLTRLGPPAPDGVVVVGGCGGLGWALVRALEAAGNRVAILDLAASLEQRGMQGRLGCLACDLHNEADIVAAFSALDTLGFAYRHVVIASGYTSELSAMSSLNTAAFDDLISGNVRGPALVGREAMARLLAGTGGTITAISTAIGQIGSKGYAGYAAAKAGLNALIRVMAAEGAPSVRVNGVAPGAVDTAFIRGGLGRGGTEDGPPARISIPAYEAIVPLGRIAVADDVTGPLLFLMSDAARYITGQVLHVNGGAFMRD